MIFLGRHPSFSRPVGERQREFLVAKARGRKIGMRVAIAVVSTVLLAACSTPGPTDLPIDGSSATNTIYINNPKIPATAREAQVTVLKYLQQTLDALPKGSSFNGERYIRGGDIRYCVDEPEDRDAPVKFTDWRDIQVAPGTDFSSFVVDMGELWKSWGWQVVEREGFAKPNRFGYAPDGYSLSTEVSYPPSYPPGIVGESPCFPGSLRTNPPPKNPVVLGQSN